ncbi:MAG: hypothetical protein H2058_00475 [Muricauda sp.]|nr:hypothetical protein [Allomuricauda sp.]MBA4743705.1 hypothetical protein [Allomuricauda sp.]
MRTKQMTGQFLMVMFGMGLFLSSCSEAGTDEFPELEMISAKAKTTTVEDQLKRVRRQSMRFHSFEQAVKAGYAEPFPFNPSPYVPQMGYHYINVGLMDGVFELDRPEILLYVPNAHGQLKLVGVEYAVPGPESSDPPEGFIGDGDHWHYNPNVAGGAWTLHVWMVLENPDGIFAPLNPNVPSQDPSED